MANLNHCSFIGNVGKIETKFTQGGMSITNISLAVNDSYNNKQTGEKLEHTEWVRAVAFGKLSEVMQKYVHKGDPLYISGKMKTDKYQAQDGSDRYSTSIVISQLQMLGGKPQGGQQQQQGNNGYQQNNNQQQRNQQQRNQQQRQPIQQQHQQSSQFDAPPDDDGFSDIPF